MHAPTSTHRAACSPLTITAPRLLIAVVLATLALIWAQATAAAGAGAAWSESWTGLTTPRPLAGLDLTLEHGEAVALAVTDMDRDGSADLLLGLAGSAGDGGVLLLHGCSEPCRSNDRDCQPFGERRIAVALPEAADWVAAADLDADGRVDVVTAARGAQRLLLLSGDGRGGLGNPRPIALPGAVTAMVAGEVNRRDGLGDVVVAVDGAAGPRLLVLESPLGNQPEEIPLPAVATTIVLGQLDEHAARDVVVACGSTVVVVHGRDRKLLHAPQVSQQVPGPAVEQVQLPSEVLALTAADLAGDDGIEELLVLGADRSLTLLEPAAAGGWLQRIGPSLGAGRGDSRAQLLAAVTSGRSRPELVIGQGSSLQVLGLEVPEGGAVWPSLETAELTLSGTLRAAAAARLNGDALADLVLLVEGEPAPLILSSASLATYTVNSADDSDDGICNATHCSLREAINAANATSALDTIQLATGATLIQPLSQLPAITYPVVLDGYWGYVVLLRSFLDGSQCVSDPCNGLTITGGSSTVRGLYLYDFADNGIEISGAGGNTVTGCVVGTDDSYGTGIGNDGHAVAIIESSDNTIGGLGEGEGNVLVNSQGGGYAGVLIHREQGGASATGNQVIANYIGVSPDGDDLGNSVGVLGRRVIGTTIGVSGGGNVITGNNTALSFEYLGGRDDIDTLVQANMVGVLDDGVTPMFHNYGVLMEGVGGVTIGGLGGVGNVISTPFSLFPCVEFSLTPATAEQSVLWGNMIGVGADGVTPVGCGSFGVYLASSADRVTIGGSLVGTANVISAANSDGVYLRQAREIWILGNRIGTSADGLSAIPNGGSGVRLEYDAVDNHIGGSGLLGNLISGNSLDGVRLSTSYEVPATGNLVQGNLIGVAADGVTPLGNGRHGISLFPTSADNLIGGDSADLGNLIAHNGESGVWVSGATGIRIRRNRIFDNGLLGIDLSPSGPTVNDPGDSDTGANELQNFPVIETADPGAGTVSFSLDSIASQTYDIDLFRSSACDGSGFGEAEWLLGATQVTTDTGGTAQLTLSGLSFSLGDVITATATDPDGNTSELSACFTVVPPTLSTGDCSANEGDSGTTTCSFTVTLSQPWSETISVSYTTGNGSASAGDDYYTKTGVISFNPDETSRTVSVTVLGDILDEDDETFTLTLSSPVNATIADGSGTGTIVDDDDPPSLSVGNCTVSEGDSGSTDCTLTVTLVPASGRTVTVDYATADGTATAGSDYTATSGTLSFNPGQTSLGISVPVLGDALNEAGETFTLTLSDPVNAGISDGSGAGRILDDDPEPTLSVSDCSVPEGDSGHSSCSFTVSLSAVSGRTVSVGYATADGTAEAGDDYVATSGTLSFTAGQTSKSIVVDIFGDTEIEPSESFSLTLSSPSYATLDDAVATGTIINDDLDILFADGFETGNLSAWSASS